MPRFLVTYRWELWLLLWAPLLGNLLGILVFTGVLHLSELLQAENPLVHRYLLHGHGAVGSLVEAGLLLAFYARVRRMERDFLTLVWGYALFLAAIGTALWLIAAAVWPDFRESGLLTYGYWTYGRSLGYGIALLFVLLRFARRASWFSLAHAYFLFLIVKTYTLDGVVGPWVIDLTPIGLQVAAGFVSVFAVGFLFAWLLGNFGSFDAVFRKRAVAGLLVVYGASVLWELVYLLIAVSDWGADLFTLAGLTAIGLSLMRLVVNTVLPLALIYLVRVRHPAPAGAEPLTDLREER